MSSTVVEGRAVGTPKRAASIMLVLVDKEASTKLSYTQKIGGRNQQTIHLIKVKCIGENSKLRDKGGYLEGHRNRAR